MSPLRRIILTIVFLVSGCVYLSSEAGAQGQLSPTTGTDNLFDKFKEDRFQDITDQDRMKKEFEGKKARYLSLMTKKSPIFVKADSQEFLEKDRIFILTGSVSIWKDDFKLESDKVIIDQFNGELKATGNVKLHFGKDLLTGDESLYNIDTGKGWITNARAAIEPSIFVEGALLEKLPDYDQTREPQYALYNGFMTSCSDERPDWKIKAKYAVIRMDNYAHMNGSSFWVSRIPLFYTPYWYYPTKSGRATGLLIPEIAWSNRRGAVISEDFFWVVNNYMDVTLGGTLFTEIGFSEKLQFRNAFDNYSKGKLDIEHLKEDESPSIDRNPQERWKARYEQTYLLPWEIRATANLDLRSDQYFDRDYGYELEQDADRFMENRFSLTKYWNLSYLSLDGTYQKDFDRFRDETVQHLPRMTYSTGQQTLFGIIKGSVTASAENIFREGKHTTSMGTEQGSLLIDDWLKRDAIRAEILPQISFDIKEFAWFSCTPWASIRETVWNNKKTLDLDNIYGTWATYPNELEQTPNAFLAGMYESGDWLRREIYSYGMEWTGPRIYKIYPVLGYESVTKLKHLIEPRITLEIIPEVDQDQVIEFDTHDRILPGRILTFSLTNRLLAKLKPPKTQDPDKDAAEKNAQSASKSTPDSTSTASSEATPAPGNIDGTPNPTEPATGASATPLNVSGGVKTTGSSENKDTSAVDRGEIREFAWVTISHTYDLLKAEKWGTEDQDPLLEGQTLRDIYPFGNIRLESTVNPFSNIYFSNRVEIDPYYHGFSNGYLYGYARSKSWKFGVRWDYTRNFVFPDSDWHSLALEGGTFLSDSFGVSSWVKYDFQNELFPYINLDLTYITQCWALTLHTYYTETQDGLGIPSNPFEITREIQFGLSISLKNMQSVGPRRFGRFWWGQE